MLSGTGYFAFPNIEHVINLQMFIPLFTAHIFSSLLLVHNKPVSNWVRQFLHTSSQHHASTPSERVTSEVMKSLTALLSCWSKVVASLAQPSPWKTCRKCYNNRLVVFLELLYKKQLFINTNLVSWNHHPSKLVFNNDWKIQFMRCFHFQGWSFPIFLWLPQQTSECAFFLSSSPHVKYIALR